MNSNQSIVDFLDSYIENPEPHYAVMLKGNWGCGKSHFINKWIEDYRQKKKKKKESDRIVLEPIKVSLYGLKSTTEITEAIDRVLHPILYSKGMNIAKKALKVAGKIVMKTSVDLNNDGSDDATFTSSLDSLALFGSRDKSVKGVKFIVFDDFERCQIEMKQLLGYINYFVEHCGCHVVIVGDDTKIEEEDKRTLDDFKEKTIGREFYVQPDISEAMDVFINEINNVWLTDHRRLAEDVFIASKCYNLRTLRQCLYDFNAQYGLLDDELRKKDKNDLPALLASFIAVYCEYKGKNKPVFSDWDNRYSLSYLLSKDTEHEDTVVREIELKYASEKFNGLNILNNRHVNQIVAQIEGCWSMKEYVEGVLRNSQVEVGALKRLEGFRDMNNDQFESSCNELSSEILHDKHTDFYSIGKAMAFFSLFEKKNLYQVNEKVIDHVKSFIPRLIKQVKSAEELYRCRNSFTQGLSIVENREGEMRIQNDVSSCYDSAFNERLKDLPNEMGIVLMALSDGNVEELFKIDLKSTPDNQTSYSLFPILKQIDATNLMKRINMLSNKSIRMFDVFLSDHYRIYHDLTSDFSNYYKEDKDCLCKLEKMIGMQVEKETSIRKMAFNKLQKTVSNCIERANGVTKTLS